MPLSPRCNKTEASRPVEPKGLAGRFMRTVLSPAGAVYSLAMAARNTAYDRGWLGAHRLEVPVICVGNLSVGGTGKTPMVIWLCRYLEGLGRRPGILSRG